MKILVTGASGLIGLELCRQLSKEGKCVLAVDNFFRGKKIPECYKFYQQDLTNPLEFLNDEADNLEIIYHLAAINGTTNFYNDPNRVISNNITIDFNIFDFAKKCKNLKKFFYSSSSEIKGHEIICTESNSIAIDDISKPRYSYRIAKIASENYLHNSNLPWVIIRYFNVYGKESRAGHFVYDQINNHKKKVFEIIGPEETRCYTYVTDAVAATIKISTRIPTNNIVNIGSNEELSSIDAVKIIARELKCIPESYKLIQGLVGSPKRRIPDISTLLKYYPEYSPIDFRTGIKKIIS